MFNFANFSIQKKINLLSFVTAVIIVLLIAEFYQILRFSEINSKEIASITNLQVFIEKQNTIVKSISYKLHQYGDKFGDSTQKNILYAELNKYFGAFSEMQKEISSLKDLDILSESELAGLEAVAKDYKALGDNLLNSPTVQDFEKNYVGFDELADKYNAMLVPLTEKIEIATTDHEKKYIQYLNEQEKIVLGSGLVAICAAILGFSYISRKISVAIKKIVHDINELANGNYGLDIKPAITTEEIGSLINASYKLRDSVERSVTLQTVIDRLAISVMMCDKDYKILYANAKANETLRALESALPIKTDNLIGSNIDIFGTNLSQNRSAPNDKSQLPQNAKIGVGTETIRLSANILQDYNSNFNGAFINWEIITDQVKADEAVRKAQEQIQKVIGAVRDGDLNTRINVDNFEGYYRDLAQGMNELVDTVKEPITRSIESLTKLSQGDLMARMEGEYKGDFKDIQTSLNATIDKLKGVVFEIRQSSESVTSASTEISSGSTDLSMRTEQQASSLEETAASMEELTKAVRNNTETSSRASTLAQEAERNAEQGGQVASNAVNAMSEIEKSSAKMADIIGVIDEIAFQINLLALNAAVEAARAGEAGKGFAVVASEVRALAGRSAAASKEIRELISTSTDQVANGAGLVKSAGESLNQILASIKEVSSLMSEIAGASKEQAQGIEEVNSAVAQMDEMTQQNAALVEENTAASQSLVDLASGLTRLINFFNVNDNESKSGGGAGHIAAERPVSSHKALPQQPNNSNASKTFEKPANKNPRPTAAQKTSAPSKASGASKASAAPSAKAGSGGGYNEGWEEF